MPRHLVVPYRDALFASKDARGDLVRGGRGGGWVWRPSVDIELPHGQGPCRFVHGLQADARNVARRLHTCAVQGHYHTEFHVRYEAGPRGPIWGVTAGCLIDDSSMAFAYNKTTPARPSLGCVVIRHAVPILVPMLTDHRSGRWIGVIP